MEKSNAYNSLSLISSRFSCLSKFASVDTVVLVWKLSLFWRASFVDNLPINYVWIVNTTLISWPPTFILFQSPWIQRQSSALYALSCQTLFCQAATQLFYVAWYKELWVIGRNVHLLLQYNQHLPLTSWATQ